jgi:hypothetical protein
MNYLPIGRRIKISKTNAIINYLFIIALIQPRHSPTPAQ